MKKRKKKLKKKFNNIVIEYWEIVNFVQLII